MSVAITGATGIVGSAVLDRLVEAGVGARALVRSTADAERMRRRGIHPVVGDILDRESLIEAFEGVDIVYHVAGLNGMCLPDSWRLMRVNVDGSRNVVRAAQAAGVRRLVYTSSAATIGEEAGTVAREDSPHRGHHLSEYERSKHLAEEVVLAEARGLEVVLVNPSSVQGPGRATGTGKLILDLLRGRLPFLVDSRLSIVDIDDCARGHLLAATTGVAGERYLLNSFTLTTSEAVDLVEEILGRRIRFTTIPVPVAMGGAAAIEVAATVVGRKPPVCREMVRTLAHGHAYDGSKAERDLGLTYTSPRDTLRRMIDWFRSEGLLEAR